MPTAPTLGAPLEGITVVDFASFFATAYGAKILSDLGADVIKIEPLGGDPMRPLPDPFEASQRGKRSLCIDLKSPEGQRVAIELCRRADVVMHNLRPGKADRLGLGPDQLRSINPDLVYCYLPGWGSRGPKAHLKSFAPLLSGFCGLLYEGGGAGNPPVPGVMGNEDYYNGFLGALGVVAALEQRSRTGTGLYLESPQLHSALFATTHEFVDATGALVPTLQLDGDQTGFSPTYRIYEAVDGWVAVACVDLGPRRGVRRRRSGSTSPPSPAGTTTIATPSPSSSPTSPSTRSSPGSSRPACRASGSSRSPTCPSSCGTSGVSQSGRIFEQHHAHHGWIREVGLTIHLSANPGHNKGPGPLLGEHSREILAEVGLGDDEIETLIGTVVKVAERGGDDE